MGAGMSDKKTTYVLWPKEDTYQRFAAYCAEDMPATLFDYVGQMQQLIENAADRGERVRKVAVEPSSMATWCRHHYRGIHSKARKAYAEHLANNGGVLLS
jgi:hypothetical protein